MSTQPVAPHHPITNISNGAINAERTATPKSSRLGSVLARVLAQQDDPHPIEHSLFSREQLARLNSSRVGKAFHIVNAKGELLRRGYVLEETKTQYVVRFIDPFTGLPCRNRRVAKSSTTNWKWYAGVEESNDAYHEHFNVTNKEATPSPRFVWTDRSLEQIYNQEPN